MSTVSTAEAPLRLDQLEDVYVSRAAAADVARVYPEKVVEYGEQGLIRVQRRPNCRPKYSLLDALKIRG